LKTSSPAVTTPGKIDSGSSSALVGLPWLDWLLLAGAGIIAFGPLAVTWNYNADYSFGWLIPVVSIVLFAERWPHRPARIEPRPGWVWPWLVPGGLVFLAFRLAAEADPDWRPGLWILVGLYVAVWARWLWLEGGVSWVRYFAFPVGFLFLSVPWPFQIEFPLTQGLMRWNAMLVAHTLQFISIQAEPAGNIIKMADCQLGVEEACSGILSLQASLVMGFLLGEIYRLSIGRRGLLVFTSILLALAGNYLRTLFLALMAFYVGPAAVPQWHDTAGYAILVFTAVGSWLAALGYAGASAKPPPPAAVPDGKTSGPVWARRPVRFVATVLAVALLVEGITQVWYVWRESKLVAHPAWAVQMPASEASFKKVALSETTLSALGCDDYEAAQWTDTSGWTWNAYWFQYKPRPYNRVVLSWHNPDKCLPSIGLVKDREYPEFTTNINGLDFYVRPKRFVSGDVSVYLFWLVYPLRGGIPQEYDDPHAPIHSKFNAKLREILDGDRGVGVETLEVALTGPATYEEAKAAYLANLKTLAFPANLAGTSR
jgi:exosortase